MKKYKKILLIISIIVVLVLSIVGFLTIKKGKALYEVKTYYGEKIENYDTNKNAFIIEKKDDNNEIWTLLIPICTVVLFIVIVAHKKELK